MKFIIIMITIMVMVVAASVIVQSKSLETFIVNGHNNTRMDRLGFYAYLEIFRQTDFGGPTMYFGGGTIISTSFILTCAQNVAGFKSWRIGLGANYISDMQWYLSTTAFIHHGYNDKTLIHNVALLRLTQHITMSSDIRILDLPTATSTSPAIGASVTLFGFGFGATDRQPAGLQFGYFEVVTQGLCEDSYPHLIQTGQTANHFCATRNRGNICAGDQGGPVWIGGESALIGIPSFYRYENCRSPEAQPAAFIRVPKYVTWINNVTSTQPL